MSIDYIDKAFFWIVPIIAEFYLPQEEVPNSISAKSFYQIFWFKCVA